MSFTNETIPQHSAASSVELAALEKLRTQSEQQRTRQARIATEIYVIVILFASIMIAYWPSLNHPPRSDQWFYLLDTINYTRFDDLLSHTYSYNRTRQVLPSDTALFRPGLFTLLAAEKAIFGNDFVLWQAFAILLHCVVCYLTYRLLVDLAYRSRLAPKTLRPTFRQLVQLKAVPLILVLFYALNSTLAEAVIWVHINGYVLFVALVLGAVLCGLQYTRAVGLGIGHPMRWLLCAWILTLVGAFTYEPGQFFAGVMGIGLMLASQKRRWFVLAAFLAVIGIYQIANNIDYHYHLAQGTFTEDVGTSTILSQVFKGDTLFNTFRFLRFTVIQPFFPSLLNVSYDTRILISENLEINSALQQSDPIAMLSLIALVLWIVLLVVGLVGLLRNFNRDTWWVGFVFLGLVGGFSGLYILGRMNIRVYSLVLSGNTHYNYLFLNAIIIISFTLWTNIPRRYSLTGLVLPKLVIYGLCGALVIVSIFSATRVYMRNLAIATYYQPFLSSVAQVQTFIDQHKAEPDFSFALDFKHPAFVLVRGIPYPMVLFGAYINNTAPKYVINLINGQIVSEPADQYRAENHISATDQLFPELVQVGNFYNIFRFNGQYLAVLYQDVFYNLDTASYVLKDRSLEGLLAQIPASLAAQDQAIQAGQFARPAGNLDDVIGPYARY